MFNTHHTHIGGGHTTVTEKRAPTDESVRMLRELEEAAEKRVVERGTSPDNGLEYRWIIMNEPGLDLLKLTVGFKLNGRDYRYDTHWCPSRFSDPREKLKIIRDQVVEKIASEVVSGLLTAGNVQTLTGR
jgi:hypothetical protein